MEQHALIEGASGNIPAIELLHIGAVVGRDAVLRYSDAVLRPPSDFDLRRRRKGESERHGRRVLHRFHGMHLAPFGSIVRRSLRARTMPRYEGHVLKPA